MSKYFIFIPNLLSITRIYLMYPLLTFIAEENYLFALYIFAIAAATDGLDGYLARVMDWQTDLGKILDPIADKILLIGTILILWLNSYIPLFVLIVFVLRDFMIIMGAAFHMTVYETAAPNPNAFGKLTTFLHIGYLAGVFIDIIFNFNLTNMLVDISVAIVTLVSLFLYGMNWFKLTAQLHRE
ncbi:MAG: CDP-alcohol phosphatidyltransferase family protein [SAR86 cluster bacterium]|jgi:cardiolipin synthase|nr:CDP-diacylglycerol--glycerol-3-phosphate 3-phosphatidyltransferase [Gammaproteobacteria bacterium]MDB4043813.1 CDP-alcohol phosphatidyltransferase family protein [Gammaproteobacteria bacterium]MDG0966341.1 CDP-alcohol phosphatidyltransferase family protein [SAR86 cluster bacterium]MDG2347394.1 CDP-alcohol phosphatidyltransferase family protein [SAR86 cluster bacterium]